MLYPWPSGPSPGGHIGHLRYYGTQKVSFRVRGSALYSRRLPSLATVHCLDMDVQVALAGLEDVSRWFKYI